MNGNKKARVMAGRKVCVERDGIARHDRAQRVPS
ncbi:hypothetical protein OKW47_001109 [Paraburkholderia atlantica]